MKLAGRLVNCSVAEQPMLLKAFESRIEPVPGVLGLGPELLYQMVGHVTMLDADLKQRRIVDHQGPEYPNPSLDEVRGWIIAGRKFVHCTSE